jgi:hypothetical protein
MLYSRRHFLRYQLLYLPDIALLPLSLSHLPELQVVFIGSIPDSLPVATMMNSLLQMMISVLLTDGNGAA